MRIAPFTCLICAALALAAGARAAPTPDQSPARRLTWRASFRRPGLVDYVGTVGVVGAAVLTEAYLPGANEARWKGGILLDESVRNALVAPSNAARQRASTVSDWLVRATWVQPWILDSWVVPLMTDSANFDVAWQMTILNLQASGTAELITTTGKRLIGRERPTVAECEKNPDYDDQCGTDPFESFPSGHSTSAFVGAGLTCAHHQSLPLYGSSFADGLACALGLGVAGTTAVLRIVADRHYATDVLTGGMIGFGAGYLMPAGIYYHAWRGRGNDAARLSIFPVPNGIQIFGEF